MQIEMNDITQLKALAKRLCLDLDTKQVSHLQTWLEQEIERLKRLTLVIDKVVNGRDATSSLFIRPFLRAVVSEATKQVLAGDSELKEEVPATTESGPNC